jgi:hypothetical protein
MPRSAFVSIFSEAVCPTGLSRYIRSLPKLAVLTSLASLGTMGAKDLAAFFTDDAIWHNIPVAPVTGRDDIATTIASFTTGIESIEFRVRNIASDGPVVLTEQVEVGRQYGGRSGVTYGSKMAGGRGLSRGPVRGPGRRIIPASRVRLSVLSVQPARTQAGRGPLVMRRSSVRFR